jgi:SpoVK/Ycf46/Vps4 family AAA+-type ATPase
MLFKMYIEKEWRPHKKLDYVRLATLTDGYVASDIEAICDEVSRDASADILDMVAGISSGEIDIEHIEKAEKHTKIDMKWLEKAIADTVSSLKMVDMSIYDKWLEKIEGK